MQQHWITILSGPPALIYTRQAELEAAGIQTFVPDAAMKLVDPFLLGGNAFALELRVPRERASEALEQLQAFNQIAAGEQRESVAEDEPIETAEHLEARRLGVRIAFASLYVVTVPYAWYLAPRYFALSRRLPRRDENFGIVIFALVLSSAIALAAIFGIGRMLGSWPY